MYWNRRRNGRKRLPEFEKLRRRAGRYAAKKSGVKIAEAGSLTDLSARLRELGIKPRDVTVESIPSAAGIRKMGLRTRTHAVSR